MPTDTRGRVCCPKFLSLARHRRHRVSNGSADCRRRANTNSFFLLFEKWSTEKAGLPRLKFTFVLTANAVALVPTAFALLRCGCSDAFLFTRRRRLPGESGDASCRGATDLPLREAESTPALHSSEALFESECGSECFSPRTLNSIEEVWYIQISNIAEATSGCARPSSDWTPDAIWRLDHSDIEGMHC